MNFFPYFIARIGGISYNALEKLGVAAAAPLLDKLLSIQEQQAALRNPVCDALHELIAQQTDNKLQNKLLNLKRAIFNGKTVKADEVTMLQQVFPVALQEQIKEYIDLQCRTEQITADAQAAFNVALVEVRDHLKTLTLDQNLQKGLLLSSQALLDNLKSYREANSGSLRKKELKTEESLIKYLTRMGAKTSPFSTFTNLSLGTIVPDVREQVLQNGEAHTITSHICLNNYLYQYLKSLLLKFPDLYRYFLIRPNPTIRQENETFVFLTNSNNIEAFQRIPYNPVVELFHDLTKDKPDGICYNELVKDIIDNEYFDATPEELETYINQLISYGFLEYNVGVSGIDPFWDRKLVEVLTEIKDAAPIVPKIIRSLQEVRTLAQSYAEAGVSDRRSIVKTAYDSFRAMCMELHELVGLPAEERRTMEEIQQEALKKRAEQQKAAAVEGEKEKGETETITEEATPAEEEEKAFMHQSNTFFHFKAEQIFYEDTTTNIVPELNYEETASILSSLKTLLLSLTDMEGSLDEQEKMTEYFTAKYEKGTSVEIMRFYEDFFRDIKKPEAERMQKLKEQAQKEKETKQEEQATPTIEKKREMPEAPALPVATLQRQQQNKARLDEFAKNVTAENKETFHVQFSGKHLKPIEEKKEKNYNRSHGAFMQFYRDEQGQLKAVSNGSFSGYGKMFSRFLHILDNKLTAELRHQNAPKTDDYLCIENCDASFFNANLHPPLMPHEIWMPGGQNTLPGEQQIPVTDLVITHEENTGKLMLTHKPTGKESYVFDLGFQGYKGRSQLFQLLTRFSLTELLFYSPLASSISAMYRSKEPMEKINEPIHYPRITFNEHLVIQRRGWIIKKELQPKFQPTATEWDFFKEINLWRKQHTMPDEVFVFMSNHNELDTLKAEQLQKLGRDGYKPQYIHFNNPMLVNLFEKMISKTPVAMRIEEMLPNSSQMLSTHGQKWVTEFVMQWYE